MRQAELAFASSKTCPPPSVLTCSLSPRILQHSQDGTKNTQNGVKVRREDIRRVPHPCQESFRSPHAFVCLYKTRKSLLRLPPWEGSKTPGSISTRTLWSYQRYNTARKHSTCQLWSTNNKLTGWLASLDIRKPHTSRILSHRIASRYATPDPIKH